MYILSVYEKCTNKKGCDYCNLLIVTLGTHAESAWVQRPFQKSISFEFSFTFFEKGLRLQFGSFWCSDSFLPFSFSFNASCDRCSLSSNRKMTIWRLKDKISSICCWKRKKELRVLHYTCTTVHCTVHCTYSCCLVCLRPYLIAHIASLNMKKIIFIPLLKLFKRMTQIAKQCCSHIVKDTRYRHMSLTMCMNIVQVDIKMTLYDERHLMHLMFRQ